MLHGLLLHIYVPLVHGYTNARTPTFHIIDIIVAWILGISLLHMHVRFLSSCHMDPRSYYMSYCAMLPYSCIHVIWLFPVTDMDNPATGHESCWYAICGIPHRLWYCSRYIVPVLYCSRFPLYCSCCIVPISRYIVLCYQQSSGPVIMLPVSCTVVVLVTL